MVMFRALFLPWGGLQVLTLRLRSSQLGVLACRPADRHVKCVLQIGKAVGAKVIAVARGPDKCAALEGLGADLVIDSATPKEPLRAAIKAVAPKGGH